MAAPSTFLTSTSDTAEVIVVAAGVVVVVVDIVVIVVVDFVVVVVVPIIAWLSRPLQSTMLLQPPSS